MLISGRNAWHSTWITRYRKNIAFYSSLPDAKAQAEVLRRQGSGLPRLSFFSGGVLTRVRVCFHPCLLCGGDLCPVVASWLAMIGRPLSRLLPDRTGEGYRPGLRGPRGAALRHSSLSESYSSTVVACGRWIEEHRQIDAGESV